MSRPALAVLRAGEQFIDDFVVRSRRFVRDERDQFFARRRQAD
jgi:hypothetical protein